MVQNIIYKCCKFTKIKFFFPFQISIFCHFYLGGIVKTKRGENKKREKEKPHIEITAVRAWTKNANCVKIHTHQTAYIEREIPATSEDRRRLFRSCHWPTDSRQNPFTISSAKFSLPFFIKK